MARWVLYFLPNLPFPPDYLVFMLARQLLALAALSLLTMSNSCKKEDDPTPCTTSADVPSSQLDGFTATIAEPLPNVGQSNEYVVNSAAEYRALFTGSKLPVVDFATHTLLAGKTRTPNCSHVLTQQVTQACTGYTYRVRLAAGPCAMPTNVVYYVIIPKMPATAKVSFDVQMQQGAASEGISTITELK